MDGSHLWSTEYRKLSLQELKDLHTDAKGFARRCWRDFRPGRPADESEDGVQDAITKLLASQTSCEPPHLDTVRKILLTAVRNEILGVRRKTRVTATYRTDRWEPSPNGKDPPLSPNRGVALTEHMSLVDHGEVLKREQSELDEDYVAQYKRLRELVARVSSNSPRARALIAQRLEALVRAGKIDPRVFKVHEGKPVDIDIAKASRAAGFGKQRKRMQSLVDDKFPEIRRMLGVETLAEFLETETLGSTAASAATTCTPNR